MILTQPPRWMPRPAGHAFSECATATLLAKPDTPPLAIGCHGQSVRHRPERGFTVQVRERSAIAAAPHGDAHDH